MCRYGIYGDGRLGDVELSTDLDEEWYFKKRLHTLSFSLHPPHQRDSKVDNDDDNVDHDSVDDDDICGDKEDEEEDYHDGE